MKNEKLLAVFIRSCVLSSLVVVFNSRAEGQNVANPEQLIYGSHCRACTPKIWDEVEAYLPRRPDGTLMQPIDDTTVMNAYRQMWYAEQSRADLCMNMWAADRVTALVKNAKTSRALASCQKQKRR